MQILIIILFVIIVAALAIHSYYANQQRQNDLMALAARHGWRFEPAKDPDMEARFGSIDCLTQGSNRYAFNVLSGKHEKYGLCAFNYHFETYSTDSKGNTETHHHQFSVMGLNTGLPLKPLLIRPEGFFDKITEFFGADDIDFESNEFSRKFYVKGPDRRFAFDVLHQATMEFLLAAPQFTIELYGPFAIAYRASQFDPDDFEQALQVVSGIIDRLPTYLLNEWKGAAR